MTNPRTPAEWAAQIEAIYYREESDPGDELRLTAEIVARIQEQAKEQGMVDLAGGIMKAARLGVSDPQTTEPGATYQEPDWETVP